MIEEEKEKGRKRRSRKVEEVRRGIKIESSFGGEERCGIGLGLEEIGRGKG